MGEDFSGFWAAENVEAGSCEITVMTMSFEKPDGGKPTASWQGKTSVTVPESPVTGIIDAGEIELKLAPAQ